MIHEYQLNDGVRSERRFARNARHAARTARRMLRKGSRGTSSYELDSSTEPEGVTTGTADHVLKLLERRLLENQHRPSSHHIISRDGHIARITITHTLEAE